VEPREGIHKQDPLLISHSDFIRVHITPLFCVFARAAVARPRNLALMVPGDFIRMHIAPVFCFFARAAVAWPRNLVLMAPGDLGGMVTK
jgi:hypothetical protein